MFRGIVGAGVAALVLSALAAVPYRRVESSGAHRVGLSEFGRGIPVSQGFDQVNGGLHAVRVHASASAPASIDVDYVLFERLNGMNVARARGAATVAVGTSVASYTFAFAPIDDSSGKSYVFELRARAVRPVSSGAVDAAVMASLDRPLRRTSLAVADRERWGSLVFETLSRTDTWFGHARQMTLPALPGPLGGASAAGAVLLVYALAIGAWAATAVRSARAPAVPDEPRAPRARSLAGVAVAILVVLGAAGAAVVARVEAGRINLIDRLYAADLQSSSRTHEAFDVQRVEIGPEARRVLFAHSTSRASWRVTLPAAARLTTAVAIHPTVWGAAAGDGVVFRVTIQVDGTTRELYMRHVNARMAADQRWIPVDIDLSAFAGRDVLLSLITEPSLPGQPPDGSYDWAIWAEPRIV